MNKLPLVAMSYQRKDAVRLIRAQAPKIAVHVALLLLYPESGSADHWRLELAAFCKKVQGYLNIKQRQLLERAVVVTKLYEEPLDAERQVLVLYNDCVDHMQDQKPTGDLSSLASVYQQLIDLCYGTSTINVLAIKNIL